MRFASWDRDGGRLLAAVQVRLDEYAAGYWSETLLHESLHAVLDESCCRACD